MTQLLVGVLAFLSAAAMLVELLRGRRHLVELAALPDRPGVPLPSVSVIIPARDEARGIEAALRSVLAQDHPGLDVTVVDDRSQDGTPRILAALAQEAPRLRVLRVDELPDGWIGKNHALHLGAAGARGELLLFTDADVRMDPTTVRRAARYLEAGGIDHLALAPRLAMPGWLLEAFGVFFGVMFTLYARPWRVDDPADPAHIGIGAFNLVRSSAYRAVGGHQPIRMRPDDDLKLGKLVKKHGFRQAFASGVGVIEVEWYHGVRAAVRGLRKNSFAGVEYRLAPILLATLVLLLLQVWPFLALFLVEGAARWLYAGCVALLVGVYAGAARHQGLPAWRGVAWPLAAVMFLVVIWNSALYTLRHRGIEWRGRHYPLDELRANRV